MEKLVFGLVGALLSSNQPAAPSQLVAQSTGGVVQVADWVDPVEKEYQELLEEDDIATEEVDQWIKESGTVSGEGEEVERAVLRARIRQRLEKVKRHYDDFLRRHPGHS